MTLTMFSDADCTRAGWIEYFANHACSELHVSVPPDADLDDTVRAFCHDEQEMILIKGWLVEWNRIED